jgi:hypothetical protein
MKTPNFPENLVNTKMTKIPNSQWITTYQTMFGEDRKQELIVDFNNYNGNIWVRVEELHTDSPYIQWFKVEDIDEAFNLVEEVKNCLS